MTGAAAHAQVTGVVQAQCNLQGAPVQLVLQYTAYQDTAVWMGQHGVGSQATDMGQLGTIWWEGYADSAYGRFNISGENSIITAISQGGYYSQRVTFQIVQQGQRNFILRDQFGDIGDVPCQITAMHQLPTISPCLPRAL